MLSPSHSSLEVEVIMQYIDVCFLAQNYSALLPADLRCFAVHLLHPDLTPTRMRQEDITCEANPMGHECRTLRSFETAMVACDLMAPPFM
jgi:hypothetical protein